MINSPRDLCCHQKGTAYQIGDVIDMIVINCTQVNSVLKERMMMMMIMMMMMVMMMMMMMMMKRDDDDANDDDGDNDNDETR